MRIISIRDDVEQAVLQYVRAIPEIFMDYDISSVELVEYHEDGLVFAADVVFVEDEIVIGDVQVGTDLMLEVDIYSVRKMTSEQII